MTVRCPKTIVLELSIKCLSVCELALLGIILTPTCQGQGQTGMAGLGQNTVLNINLFGHVPK